METETHAHKLQDYIAHGFDPATAEYFAAGRRGVTQISPVHDFRLELTFDNNETRIYDVKPLLRTFTVFEPLWDENLFSKVYLDEERCISWDVPAEVSGFAEWFPKISLSSDTCYLNSTLIQNK